MIKRTPEQLIAADPQHSAWVFASAGSGKTSILRDRVLRLLLDGIEPDNILCLTYTKAAAAEMANRIASQLAEWASLSSAQLNGQLRALLGFPPGPDRIEQAGKLFAKILDLPGGLRIMTIHAFCQSLLRRFPLEAGILPHFDPMEESDAALLRQEAMQEALAAIASDENADLRNAFDQFVTKGEIQFSQALREIFQAREKLLHLKEFSPDPGAIRNAYATALAAPLHENPDRLIFDACHEDRFDGNNLRRAIAALKNGKKRAQERGYGIQQWLAKTQEERSQTWEEYRSLFLTRDGTIFDKLADADSQKEWPGLSEILASEAERILILEERCRLLSTRDISAALTIVAIDILSRYEEAKRRAARLDYDDLIMRARSLLLRPGIAPWVLFKMDGQLRHLLIDEGQDTNDPQWEIVKALTGEFFAGIGKDDTPRTIFAVGDIKQSIYGFQGTDARTFLAARDYFSTRIASKQKFRDDLSVVTSFRSAPLVLDFVDRVFMAESGEFLTGTDEPVRHTAFHRDKAGEIQCWPLAVKIKSKEGDFWPLGENPSLSLSDPASMLAERMALEIKALLGQGVDPGDILVLVRKRNHFIDVLVRALKKEDVPVSGVDRLNLLEDIAVLDLLAFGEFLLLPEDDLNLANLLKSPLFDLTDEDLLEFAPRRVGSLWHALGRTQNARGIQAHQALKTYLAQADFIPPFDLYSNLLRRDGGRKKFYTRLGMERAEAIDEFLTLAQVYESSHAPSLQGFLQWLKAGNKEVKRHPEDKEIGEVRIMTIHGAKGAEAPVVFLIENQGGNPPAKKIYWQNGKQVALPLWVTTKQSTCKLALDLKQEEEKRVEQEEQRLLYVGMTRAKERLYLCGWAAKEKAATRSWHNQWLKAGMEFAERESLNFDLPGWLGEGFILRKGEKPTSLKKSSREKLADLPELLLHPAPLEAKQAPLLSPSRLTEVPVKFGNAAAEDGRRRGILLHRLLELLPQIQEDKWDIAMKDYLRQYTDWGEGFQAEIGQEILAILRHQEYGALFSGETLAELPIAGTIDLPSAEKAMITGRIDRVLLREEECFLLDYKSNRLYPTDTTQINLAYVRQMALYRAMFQKLYPNKTIRCLLLWTVGPLLLEIPATAMDKALQEIRLA